jgi:hypothetical protein
MTQEKFLLEVSGPQNTQLIETAGKEDGRSRVIGLRKAFPNDQGRYNLVREWPNGTRERLRVSMPPRTIKQIIQGLVRSI